MREVGREGALKGLFAGFRSCSWREQIFPFDLHPRFDINVTIDGVPYDKLALDIQCVDASSLGWPMGLLVNVEHHSKDRELAKVVAKVAWAAIFVPVRLQSRHRVYSSELSEPVLWQLIHEAGGYLEKPDDYPGFSRTS